MVILAVNIGSNRATYSNEFRARSYRRKIAARREVLQDLRKADTSFALEHSRILVK